MNKMKPMSDNETYAYAKDLRPGQVFRVPEHTTLYTVTLPVRTGGGRTIVSYMVDGQHWEMNIPSLSSCYVQD